MGTTVQFGIDLGDPGGSAVTIQDAVLPGVPWFVYVFSVLGALGFVFTALIDDFRSSTLELLQYNLRVPAALPLGAGIFLFSGVLLNGADSGPLVVALVFLSGLYVNLAYKQLGALARRFLPDTSEDRVDETARARDRE